jgi:Cytochrome P450
MAQISTQILHRLLENPEHLEPLRQEIETAVAEEGWTKAAIDKMHNLDSFLRETQRINPISIGLSAPLHGSHFTDIFSPSESDSSRTAPFHIFQRRDYPPGHASVGSVKRYPYGWRNISEP